MLTLQLMWWLLLQVVALLVAFLWQGWACSKGYNVSATHSISESGGYAIVAQWHSGTVALPGIIFVCFNAAEQSATLGTTTSSG
jgi:hypothetical protein